MDAIARYAVLALTLAALVHLWVNRNPPPIMVETPYCVVDVLAAAKDEQGNWHSFWGQGYRPCTELDRYENT